MNYFSNNIRFKFFREIFIYLIQIFWIYNQTKSHTKLKVFNISFSDISFCFNHLNIFKTLILSKLISAHNPKGITLFMFSANPPPVIFAQPFNKFF